MLKPLHPLPHCGTVQVRKLAVDFLREAQRHYYATPTSYLELIQTYKELLGQKRNAVGAGS